MAKTKECANGLPMLGANASHPLRARAWFANDIRHSCALLLHKRGSDATKRPVAGLNFENEDRGLAGRWMLDVALGRCR
jgi:hypothetical protein